MSITTEDDWRQDSISSLYRDMMQYAYDVQDGKKEFVPDEFVEIMQSFGERMAIMVYMTEKYACVRDEIKLKPIMIKN
ncbi:hypothetical protein [Methanooceanicella nereidis]|uniref:hypothetical protein n=1 Tax=Methanooceanicella nereidis TaxID=2052831 RepID=UPI001E37B7BD|nr:hypothetical protein [Methanocella sp. CWC-04]